MTDVFTFDERLGMLVPALEMEWEEYSQEERRIILERWEDIRGDIPRLIGEFEERIADCQARMQEEEDWDKTVALVEEMNDYASRINDLNILFRTEPSLEAE